MKLANDISTTSPYDNKSNKEVFDTKELALILRVSTDWLSTLRTQKGSIDKNSNKRKLEYIEFFKFGGKILYKTENILKMISVSNPHFDTRKYNTLDFLLPIEVAHMLHMTLSHLSKLRNQKSRFDKNGFQRLDYIEYIKIGKRVLYHRKSVENVIRKIKKKKVLRCQTQIILNSQNF